MAGKTIDLGKVRGNDAVYGVVNSTVDGLAPKTGGVSAAKYLRADATWQVPPDTTYTGSSLKMTGYVKGSNKSAVTTSDSVNQAVGKLENRIDEQNTNLAAVYIPFSFGSAITSDKNSYVFKSNGIVTINLAFTGTLNGETAVTTLPAGYRPGKQIWPVCKLETDVNNTVYCYINPNGQVVARCGSDSRQTFYISISFPAQN